MKDERPSTLPNSAGRPEPTPDDLRITLGQRVRAARGAVEMSQQALADAMAQYGFNWRQTTVAKVEAADRPTLFTEVVALSRIFHKDMEFFFTTRGALGDVIDELRLKTNELKQRAERTYQELKILENELAAAKIEEAVALSILIFRHNGDSGELRATIDRFTSSEAFSLHRLGDVLQAAGVPQSEVDAADYTAIREVAAVTLMHADSMRIEQPNETFADGYLVNAAAIIKGGTVDPAYFRMARHDPAWRSHFSQLLVDLIVDFGSE